MNMGELETAWMMLQDALGIGRPAEPMTIAALFLIFLLSILAGCAAGKLLIWLPEGIKGLLLLLWEVLAAVLHRLFGRAEEKGGKQVPERNSKLLCPVSERPRAGFVNTRARMQPEENEEAGQDDKAGEDKPEDAPEHESRPEEMDSQERPEEPKEENPKSMRKNVFLERKLTEKKRAELSMRGYRRLKISAFGDSGASYYLVKPRWNEGLKHAFFCHLVEAELWKRGKRASLNANSGPDIVFEHGGMSYYFDIETGTNLERHRDRMEFKFSLYRHAGSQLYILVTGKKLKPKYRKYGIVITRANLRKALDRILDIHII